MRIGLSGGMSTPEIRGMCGLSLLLLVLGVRADHAHHAFAAHDLAVLTNPSDAGAYFHDCTLLTFTTQPACAGGIRLYSLKNRTSQARHTVRMRSSNLTVTEVTVPAQLTS